MTLTVVDSIWPTIGSILLSLTVTFLFNYFVGLPKKFNDAKKAEQKEKDELAEENRERDRRLDKLEEAVNNIKLESRRYAKRQITWFKRTEGLNWFDVSNDFNEVNYQDIISGDEIIKIYYNEILLDTYKINNNI